ncbi:class I SAM-dependent methyltransferase [bacterium]|nr:class I SAM-dependent methyltransferase [bacterium]
MSSLKIKYLVDSTLGFFSSKTCPSCQSPDVSIIDRKYIVTRLFECNQCHLYFRHPKDNISFNKEFYQDDYQQEGGFTTDLPDDNSLETFIGNNFDNSDKSVKPFLNVFESLFSQGIDQLKIVDYGCSWGYMSYQFLKAGMNVESFEISIPRSNYGNKKLGLNIKTSEDDLELNNDIFFSSHVIEHLPDIPKMVTYAKKVLKHDGLFIAECPNGSKEFKMKHPNKFHRGWGLVHPNYLNAEYYKNLFSDNPYLITSTPYTKELFDKWDQQSQLTHQLDGANLFVIVKLNQSI